MMQSAQNNPYEEFRPSLEIKPATRLAEKRNFNDYQQLTIVPDVNNNAQINYLPPTIFPAESISGFPVCKSRLSDGSFELTFGGIIPAPPATASNRLKSNYITNIIKAMNLPDLTGAKPSGSLVQVNSVEFLTYGNLQINTENYESFPQKINCCTVCWKPPVYMSRKVLFCLFGILAFFYITPIIIITIVLSRKAAIYNMYITRVRIAAENIRRNGGAYIADEPAAVATINRLRNIAAFMLPAEAIAPIKQTSQYQQAPQFAPPLVSLLHLPGNDDITESKIDKKDKDHINLSENPTILPF